MKWRIRVAEGSLKRWKNMTHPDTTIQSSVRLVVPLRTIVPVLIGPVVHAGRMQVINLELVR